MCDTEVLLELLVRWHESRENGKAPAAEELCADRPDLVQKLRERIQALLAVEAMVESETLIRGAAKFESEGEAKTSDGATPNGDLSTPLASKIRVLIAIIPFNLAGNPTRWLCPGCGSSFRLREAHYTDTTSGMKQMGKFQLLERLGLGGFGAVWKARDTELDRIVALKIPHTGLLTEREEFERFQREARAAANLRHPNIVTVHEVATLNSLPVIVAEFVPGVPLKDMLEARRLTFRQAAAFIAEVADALEYAHSLGVVHRDVKPANIMILREPPTEIRPRSQGDLADIGKPMILDFGLALREAVETTMTVDGHVLGTPAYMSPEQASGLSHKADRRSDGYSLGVILYEMLTGELPFRGSRSMMMYQVMHEEPRALRKINDRIPRDLETICLKCLAKAPAGRYADARELADDLRRWLAGEPILARPVGTVERLWRWAKRKPALAVMTGMALAGVLAAFIAITGALIAVSGALNNETKARENEAKVAKANKKLAQDAEVAAETQRKLAAANKNLADDAEVAAETQRKLATANKKLADDADARREEAEELALKVSFNGLHAKGEDNAALTLVGTAQLLPRAARLKDQRMFKSLRLHLAGWAPEVKKTGLRWIGEHQREVTCVALSADGKTALTGSLDKTARLWDAVTGMPIGPPLQHQDFVRVVALSANGKTAITMGNYDKTARLWDASTGKPIGPPLQHQDIVRIVALSANGKTALTGSWDKTARLWDVATGKPIGPPLQHQDAVRVVALSADGKTALTGSYDKTARLWDTATGMQIGQPLQHKRGANVVALSADGMTALSVEAVPQGLMGGITRNEDKIARLWVVSPATPWEGATSKRLGPPLQHQDKVVAVALSADGKTALTGSSDKTARLWETVADKPIGPGINWVVAVALSADGKTALTATDSGARLWDAATTKPIGPPIKLLGSPIKPLGPPITRLDPREIMTRHAVALSSDGKTALLVEALRVSADGKTQTGASSAQLCDAASGKPLGPVLNHKSVVRAVSLSADGKTALTGSYDMTARLWDAVTGKSLGPPLQHQNKVIAVALSADGRIALTGSADKTARLWDAATRKPLGPPLQHQGHVSAVALSADGKTALTGSNTTALLWDAATGKPIGPPLQHQDKVVAVSLSADGATALTGSLDNTARLWDAAGKPIGPPLRHSGAVFAVALSADGKTALTGSADRTARLWKLPRLPNDPERMILWTQVLTGIEADDFGNPVSCAPPNGKSVRSASPSSAARRWSECRKVKVNVP